MSLENKTGLATATKVAKLSMIRQQIREELNPDRLQPALPQTRSWLRSPRIGESQTGYL